MQQTIHHSGVVIALFTLEFMSVQAQSAFLRKDIQVPGQYGIFGIQIPGGNIAVGDYNGDGRPDLVASSDRGVDVLLNMGGGNFGRPIHTASVAFGALISADFNGDGKLDLIVPDASSLIGHLLVGRGDGTFFPPRDLPGVGVAVAGDFNSDGKVDLVVNDGGSLRILLGNGDGRFRRGADIQRFAISYTNQLATADFNGDGRADLAVNYGDPWNGYAVSISLGNGDGSFQAVRTMSVRAATLLVADLNGDGLPDLITGYDILVGKGDGSFEPRPYFTATDVVDVPVPFAAADFDNDGHMDLAVGSRYLYAVSNHVLIFRGKADGTMLPPIQYEVGWQPAAGAVADLDGDGRSDLATANLASNTVSLLLSGDARDPRLVRALSAASGTAIVAPGSLATLYTSGVASVAAWSGSPPWPTALGSVSLEIHDSNGTSRLAPLLYVAGIQINFLVPEGTALGEATLNIVRDTDSTQAGTMQVTAVAPGLFLATDYSLTPAAFLLRVQPDGFRSSQPLFECSRPNACAPVRVKAPPPGSRSYLVFYGTGFRDAPRGTVKCSIASFEFPVEHAANGETGLDQISVPLEFYPYSDFWISVWVNSMAEVTLSSDGVLANRVLLLFDAPELPCWSCK